MFAGFHRDRIGDILNWELASPKTNTDCWAHHDEVRPPLLRRTKIEIYRRLISPALTVSCYGLGTLEGLNRLLKLLHSYFIDDCIRDPCQVISEYSRSRTIMFLYRTRGFLLLLSRGCRLLYFRPLPLTYAREMRIEFSVAMTGSSENKLSYSD